MFQRTARLAIVATTLSALLAQTGEAEEDAPSHSKSARRYNRFNLELNYTGEAMANVSGGLKRGTAVSGLGNLILDYADGYADRGLSVLSFRASGLLLHGENPSKKYIGDELAASNIDGYDSIRLYELWFQLSFWNNRASLRLGSLLADVEFVVTDLGGLFFNSAFGWPTFISANTVNTGPAFFVTAPGIRLRLQPAKSWYIQGAVYDGDSFDDPTGDGRTSAHGIHWQISSQQGYFSILEFGRTEGRDAHNNSMLKLGGWAHSAQFTDNLTGAPLHGNYGLFLAMERSFWRGGREGKELGIFLRGGLSPQDRNRYELAIDGGFNLLDPFVRVKGDVIGAGITLAKISDHIHQVEEKADELPLSDYEMVLEFTCQFSAAPWLVLQPNIQWIRHPGSSNALSDALVLSIRSNFTF